MQRYHKYTLVLIESSAGQKLQKDVWFRTEQNTNILPISKCIFFNDFFNPIASKCVPKGPNSNKFVPKSPNSNESERICLANDLLPKRRKAIT